MIQTIDLAARFSACILRERSGEIVDQFDSMGLSPFAFAAKVGKWARDPRVELTVFEDVPYNPNYTQAMVKPVLRLQGIMMSVCHPVLDQTFTLDPSTWMRMFPGIQRAPKGLTKSESDKYRVEQANKHAAERGYTPPDLVQQYIDSLPAGARVLKKNTAPLEKSMTDYVSAFLMSEFICSMSKQEFTELPSGVFPFYI